MAGRARALAHPLEGPRGGRGPPAQELRLQAVPGARLPPSRPQPAAHRDAASEQNRRGTGYSRFLVRSLVRSLVRTVSVEVWGAAFCGAPVCRWCVRPFGGGGKGFKDPQRLRVPLNEWHDVWYPAFPDQAVNMVFCGWQTHVLLVYCCTHMGTR